MPETWTGNLIGKMHNKDVTYDELAEEMGVTKSYVSMILNGHRRPPDIRNRMEVAFNSIIQRRNGVTVDELLSDQGEGGGEVREMDNQQILETLEKQLQLLSERSKKCISDSDLVALSNAMLSISQFLLNP